METYLRCRVSRGMFRSEVAVQGASADGTEFSLFVPNDIVDVDRSQVEGGPVDGWLMVEKLDQQGDLVLVRLPGETFENGRTVTVRLADLQHRPRNERVGADR